MPRWLANLRNQPLAIRAGVLIGVVVLCAALVCPAAVWWHGGVGAVAAGVAAALCLVGASGALVISHLFDGLPPQQGLLTGVMLAMAVRLGIPLGLGMAVHLSGGALAEAGFLYYLLIFYPLTLATETVLSLPQPQPPGSPPRNPNG